MCLDASFEVLRRYLKAPGIVWHAYRKFIVKKFPVSIYCIVREDNIYIDVVEPMTRGPKHLDRKLTKKISVFLARISGLQPCWKSQHERLVQS